MRTVPEPPGNSFEPLGKPIRPEVKPAPTAPAPTENPRIGKRLDGMLETLIPGNDAKADDWKILPGQRYRCVVFRDGRKLATQRARLDMDGLCDRHGLYDDA